MVKISKFSAKQKFEVLYDCGIRRATTLTRLSGIHMSTTYRYLERIEKEGTLERHSGSGGKNKTTKKVERKVIQKLKNSKNPLTMQEMKNLYPEGFVFMQDNDPKHKANITKNYLHKNFMDVLDWPAYSPDLNPIENIWGWLKAMVSKEIPQNLDDLEKIIKKHWKSITPMMIQPYIDGMEQRFRDVLSKHGGYINK